MLRVFVVAIIGAVLLSAGPTEAKRLTKQQYLAAAASATNEPVITRLSDQVIEFEFPGTPPSHAQWLAQERRLRTEIARVADRLERLEPPADVAAVHVAWISSLRFCARQLEKLETASPLDPLIAERGLQPCFEAHRKVCDRFYARGYSFG